MELEDYWLDTQVQTGRAVWVLQQGSLTFADPEERALEMSSTSWNQQRPHQGHSECLNLRYLPCKMGTGISGQFRATKGLKQECCLYLSLFKIFIALKDSSNGQM